MAQQQEADDLDEGHYVWFGTPINDETAAKSSAFRKEVLDPAKTRAAPITEQEPTDEQGRKRFHGAFTGGFSAGYFNTVGSKEGWAPSTFRSSRSDRAAVKAQSVDDFLDEDEKKERGKITLLVQGEYDTFGSAAAEAARGASQRDATARPSLIPGPAIDELIAPVAESKGARLLMKMGWRPGRGVGAAPVSQAEASKRSRWGSVAGVSLDNTPLYVLEPKQDVHGLGFDPFSGAEDFRSLKQQRVAQREAELKQAAADATSRQGLGGEGAAGGAKKRPRGIAFGGFTEDSGMYGYMEDYVDEEDDRGRPTRESVLTGGGGSRAGFHYELEDNSGSDDDMPGRRKRPLLLEADDKPKPLMLQTAAQLRRGGDFIPGFVKAEEQVVMAVYPGPDVPADWDEHHIFPPKQTQAQSEGLPLPPPPEVPPPSDPDLKRTIDSLAAMVARTGPAVETLARKQAQRAADTPTHDPSHTHSHSYSFLIGGEGSQYYLWRLSRIRAALAQAAKAGAGGEPVAGAGGGRPRGALTVEQRMALLGEEALPATEAAKKALAAAQGAQAQGVAEGDKQRLQQAMSSMFVRAENQDMGSSQLDGGFRPRTAPTTTTATNPTPPALSTTAAAVLAGLGNRFTSGSSTTSVLQPEVRAGGLMQASSSRAVEPAQPKAEAEAPKRWFEDWRPEPLVCKRFNVPDPYKGRPAPVEAPKFKTDTLMLPETSAGLHLLQQQPAAEALPLPPPPPLPIDMQAAVARAAAIAQRLTGGPAAAAAEPPAAAAEAQPPMSTQPPQASQAKDAKDYAADFLSGLFGAPSAQPTSTPTPPNPTSTGPAAAPQQPPQPASQERDSDAAAALDVGASADFVSTDRPLDIFKAIFEADDNEDTGDEETEGVNGTDYSKGVDGTGQAGNGQPGQPGPSAPAQPQQPVQATAKQAGLASALLQAQQIAAEKAAQAAAKQQASAAQGSGGPMVGPVLPPGAGGGGSGAGPGPGGGNVDPEVQQRILAALGMLKRSSGKDKKKRDKDKKDRDKRRSQKGKKSKKTKSDKSKHKGGSKSKSKDRGKKRRSHDTESEGSGSDSGGSDSSSGDDMTDSD